jgi:hypothetical protein
MNWRILWGHQLENKINDLEGRDFEEAAYEGRAKFPEPYNSFPNPSNRLLSYLEKTNTPFVILYRVDGFSWTCWTDGENGHELYYDSIMRADQEPDPEP